MEEETSGDCLVNPLHKEGCLEQVDKGHVQSGFRYLQEWRLYNI